jgi:branched-chain amino acid transport system substrate-binding protein
MRWKGLAADLAVAEAFRTMNGAVEISGRAARSTKGRRVAPASSSQWQSGAPITVYPPDLALAEPFWPKKS